MRTQKLSRRAFAAAVSATAALALLSPSEALGEGEVTNVVLELASPAAIRNGTHIHFTYDYQTDLPGGIRTFPFAYSDGQRVLPGGSSGANTHEMGSGTGDGFFTVPEGVVTVDELLIRVWAQDGGEIVSEAVIPVFYHFNPNVDITGITADPESPATLVFGERVNFTYDYASEVAGGIRIWPRPVTNGSLTPNYGASGSGIHTGAGTTTGFFTIRSGDPVLVDHTRFIVRNSDQSVLLATFDIPVSYMFDAGTPVVERTWGQIKASGLSR